MYPMTQWLKKWWKFLLGMAISGVFLYSVVVKLEWVDFWEALKTANYGWIIPGGVMYLAAMWARAWRWHYLLRPVKSISTRKMFPIVAIGYMGNNIYPARAGEVLRAGVLKRGEGVPISASLATVIVERIFDGVVMLAFVFVNLAELSRLTGGSGVIGNIGIRDVAIWGSAIFFGALAVFLLAAMFPRPAEKLAHWLTGRLVPARLRPQLLGITGKFLGGLESLRSPLDALMVFVTSVVIWLLETGKYWLVMHAFPSPTWASVTFFTLMLMNGVVNLATTLPSAPGYVGTFDKPGIAVLEAYGVDTAIATGYTLVLHVALWIVPTALGAYYFAREGLKWGEDVGKLRVEEPALSQSPERSEGAADRC